MCDGILQRRTPLALHPAAPPPSAAGGVAHGEFGRELGDEGIHLRLDFTSWSWNLSSSASGALGAGNLREERDAGRHPAVEGRQVQSFVRGVHPVVRKSETHHDHR